MEAIYKMDYDTMLKLIECPVCLSTPRRSSQCSNGHILCSGCRSKLATCPVCRDPFTSVHIRNLIADSMIKMALHKCISAGYGCPEKMLLPDIQKHEQEECQFRLVGCPSVRCLNITVPFCKLSEHFKENRCLVLETSDLKTIIYTAREVKNNKDDLLKFDNKEFFLENVFAEKYFLLGVGIVGSKEETSKYYCHIEIKQDIWSVAANTTVFSHETHVDQLKRSLPIILTEEKWNHLGDQYRNVRVSFYVFKWKENFGGIRAY